MFYYRLMFVFFTLFTSYSVLAEAGVVAFSIGETSVKKGGLIEVGQTITTGANGHVYIRFIDDALVSLRPNTELTVQTYQYDPDSPETNRVKFYLKKGTARSVTGKAGQLNKDGYRMNTPISAIGIRGTDYTVSTTDEQTRVVVKKGGVAIAPLDDQCLADGYGACDSPYLIELSAGGSHILDISTLKNKSLNISFENDLTKPNIIDSQSLVNTQFLDTDIAFSDPGINNTQEIGWAHWSRYTDLLGKQFIEMSPYLNQDWRIVSVNSFFGLFVPNSYEASPKTGVLDFELDRYQFFSVKDNQIALAQINDPSLRVNFENQDFTVHLGVSNQFIDTTIAATGNVDRQGYLTFLGDNQKITGALNPQLDQAGLLFDVQLDNATEVIGSSAWIKR
jgi:hypothetical protein